MPSVRELSWSGSSQRFANREIIRVEAIPAAVSGTQFRKKGKNEIPVSHDRGLLEYHGERSIPAELLKYRGHEGKQTGNRYSHWIWRQYASSFWDDIRLDNVLPFKGGRDVDDEKHVHPLQLDVIDRCVSLWSNPNEVVLTPFMGVGSEVYSPVSLGRKAIGIELKDSYYKQAVINLKHAKNRFKNKKGQQKLAL